MRIAPLASEETEAEVMACAEVGVSSFVTRDDSLADLVITIRAAQGESHVSPRMAPALLRRVAMTATRRIPRTAETRLTRHEVEVLQLIEEGPTNKETRFGCRWRCRR